MHQLNKSIFLDCEDSPIRGGELSELAQIGMFQIKFPNEVGPLEAEKRERRKLLEEIKSYGKRNI